MWVVLKWGYRHKQPNVYVQVAIFMDSDTYPKISGVVSGQLRSFTKIPIVETFGHIGSFMTFVLDEDALSFPEEMHCFGERERIESIGNEHKRYGHEICRTCLLQEVLDPGATDTAQVSVLTVREALWKSAGSVLRRNSFLRECAFGRICV
jgi:hypothetical protein